MAKSDPFSPHLSKRSERAGSRRPLLRGDVLERDVGVMVPSALRSGASPDLDRGHRAPVNAREALLAPMMPARASDAIGKTRSPEAPRGLAH